ncbi:MAG: glucosamine-6-phosphate deaminase [Syntrophomonadaceae bacterium]
MITKIYKDYKELSAETAMQIAEVIKEKSDALLCFPAGETSEGTFQELIRLQENGLTDFSRCKIVGLDEWVHLGKMKSENCYNFLKSRLFDRLPLNPLNMHFFNGEAEDLELECRLTDEFIKTNGGIDMMLLGVGMNGHLGLNEPGAPSDKYSHVVDLDNVTKEVGQKYFSENVKLTRGITLGLRHIMETGTVIVQLSGKKKSPVVKRLLETEPAMDFPVSIVKMHPNAFLLLDSEASQYQVREAFK